jgi:hypothetical protein
MLKLKLPLLAVIILLAAGCQKETNQPTLKESISKQPIEKQFAYVHENLKSIMAELGQLMKDPGFKGLIKSEAAKKFDGSHNVLIKTLLNNPFYGQRLNTENMRKALDAFRNINEENLYPQIYIPFFDKHQANRNNITARTSVVSEEGVVIPTGTIVNEEYALNNELYVISINETVNDDGEVPPIANTTTQTLATVNFRIEMIYVKQGKESWLAGDSEVHIKATGTTWNHRQYGNPNSTIWVYPVLRYASSTDYKGHEIKKVLRSDINSGVGSQYIINYPLHTGWPVDNFFSDPIVYSYVVFEYDKWPAERKTAASLIPSSPDPNANKDFFNFRSSNSPYGGEVDSYDSYTTYSIYGNVSGLPAFPNLYYDGYFILQLHWNSQQKNIKRKYKKGQMPLF